MGSQDGPDRLAVVAGVQVHARVRRQVTHLLVNLADGRVQQRGVMPVRPSRDDPERDTAAVGPHGPLHALFTPIHRGRTRLVPTTRRLGDTAVTGQIRHLQTDHPMEPHGQLQSVENSMIDQGHACIHSALIGVPVPHLLPVALSLIRCPVNRSSATGIAVRYQVCQAQALSLATRKIVSRRGWESGDTASPGRATTSAGRAPGRRRTCPR